MLDPIVPENVFVPLPVIDNIPCLSTDVEIAVEIVFVPVNESSRVPEDDKVMPFVIVGSLVNLALPPEIVISFT